MPLMPSSITQIFQLGSRNIEAWNRTQYLHLVVLPNTVAFLICITSCACPWLPHEAWSLPLIAWWIIASILGSAGLVKLWAITIQNVGNLSLTYVLTMRVWSILYSHEVHVYTIMACSSIVNKPTTSMLRFLIRRNMWLHDALTMLLHSANNVDLNPKHSTIVLCFHSGYI